MADVICALSTAPAQSAIGVVRLSGDGCCSVAEKIFTPLRGALSDAQNRRLVLGTLTNREGQTIDQCMAVYSRAPHSYTGEDTVELQCHGSPAVLSAALQALIAHGARMAEPGEFTKRAFLNGRMDLTQAEAVIDLIESSTAEAAANAASQVGGALRRSVEGIYDRLTDVLAHFHAVVDYPDEDIDPFELSQQRQSLAAEAAQLRSLSASYARGQILKDGVRAVILGRPNVGKSSLLNALAGYERVIVTATAGTTRDTVEEQVRVGGVLLRLTDTAGIRDTADEIERMGVDRSLQAAEGAQLALFVCDGSEPLTEEDHRAITAARQAECAIGLINKSDLAQVVTELPFDTVLTISAKDARGLDALEEIIRARFGTEGHQSGSILTNARQAGAVEQALAALERTLQSLDAGFTPDAVLLDVEAALAALGEITGRHMREEIVSRIFSRFCVGK